MKKLVPLAVLASLALSLGAATLPAAAATPAAPATMGPASSPSCDVTQSQLDDTLGTIISQRLAAEGYAVDSLQASGGCLEAFVHKGNVAEVLHLDPTYLTPIGSNGTMG